jgi:CBS domain-containing protein
MESIADVLTHKGMRVLTIPLDSTVQDAVERMCAERVGALLVCDGNRPVGTFTERDLLSRVVRPRRDPLRTLVRDMMTPDVVCVTPETLIREAMAVMTERRCRHLPVVAEGRICGLVSIGDLIRFMSREAEFEIRMLRDYLSR